MDANPVADNEILIRITYTPEHHDGSRFLNGAVSLEDLKSRGFSVDRPSITTRHSVIRRVAAQSQRNPGERQRVLFSELFCRSIRSELDENGEQVFLVNATPDPARGNLGHASILSRKQLGAGGLRKIRVTLLNHLNRLTEFEKIGFPLED